MQKDPLNSSLINAIKHLLALHIPKYLSLFLGITTKQPIMNPLNANSWRKQKSFGLF